MILLIYSVLLRMMIYQLFIAAAIGFVMFTSISDANCKFWFDTCVGSCAVPNNRTIRICQLECELETLEIEANPALTHNETMCVEKCLTNPDVVTDCQEGCEEAYEACEQGCSAAKVSTASHIEVMISPSRDTFDNSFPLIPLFFPLSSFLFRFRFSLSGCH